tara:strand:+ start:1591 stop:2142 length:552 start_codon:yes stop_codon:yes gene_type:complete
MKPNKIKISKIKSNLKNPRLIKDQKFKNLVKSIKEFPEMLKLRPIVVDENNIILGGNMRYKASIEAGLKEIYAIQADNLSEDQKKEFIIKDNVGFGEWDWDILANEFDNKELNEWGLDVWQTDDDIELEDFFNEEIDLEEKDSNKITLEYTKEDYDIVIAAFDRHNAGKEELVKMLLLSNIKL